MSQVLSPVKVSSIKIQSNLFLVRETISETTEVTKVAVNHIIILDCSGSMYRSLPEQRRHLKNILPTMVKEGDTVTLGWFSGKGEYGILQEALEVNDLKDHAKLSGVIDRFYQPMGLTGFKEPLEALVDVLERIKQNKPDSVFSLFFETDGYDNQWSKDEILAACHLIKPYLSAATVVGYSYYYNQQLLLDMAESLGGVFIHASDFPQYVPVLETTISKDVLHGAEKQHKLEKAPNHNFAFRMPSTGDVTPYKVKEGNVSVTEDTDAIYYLTNDGGGSDSGFNDVLTPKAALAAIYLLAQQNKSTDVYSIIFGLGDKNLLNLYSGALGKQKQLEFQSHVRNLMLSADGYDAKGETLTMPPDDQYCLVDLLQDLSKEPGVRWFPFSSYFQYKRIGPKQVDANSVFSKTDLEKVKELTDKLHSQGDVLPLDAFNAVMLELQTLQAKKVPLEVTRVDRFDGYPFEKLVMNEDRPNISAEVTYDCFVNLPTNDYGFAAEKTTQTRAYTLVKDGIRNVDVLPVYIPNGAFKNKLEEKLGADLFKKSLDINISAGPNDAIHVISLIHLESLPIINRKMVQDVSAVETFKLAYDLLKLEATIKVAKALIKERETTPADDRLVTTYGVDCADWLKSLGFTGNSFNPKKTTLRGGDSYEAVQIRIKISGASSLPAVSEVLSKVDNGKKLNIADQLLYGAYNELKHFGTDDIKLKLNEAYKQQAESRTKMSRIKFALILGQTWFTDIPDNNKMTLTLDNHDVSFEAVLEDKTVKL